MTDKEMIHHAAHTKDAFTLGGVEWNPLKDDGDALRLAVKLGLTIYQWEDEVCVCNSRGTTNESVSRIGDVCAATRRAIVRAAAEIGKNK